MGLNCSPQRLGASRPTPPLARCPQCDQMRPRAELRRKTMGQRLLCCTTCYRARRQAGRVRWEQANRDKRTRQRHSGGVPCPAYEAWTASVYGPGVCLLALASGEPIALAMPAYGTCSCGEAGCVHLVMACLAQQGQDGNDEGRRDDAAS